MHRHLHLGADVPTGRRYALARRVAGLLHRYEVSRPEVLQAWARDEVDVPADLRWQPLLWRRLREDSAPARPSCCPTPSPGWRPRPRRCGCPRG